MAESSIEKLVFAILLSSIKKGATEFRMGRDAQRVLRIDFLIDGLAHEELRLPAELQQPLLARFAEMASVVIPPPDHTSHGYIQIGDGAQHHYFELEIRAAGTLRTLRVRAITQAEMP